MLTLAPGFKQLGSAALITPPRPQVKLLPREPRASHGIAPLYRQGPVGRCAREGFAQSTVSTSAEAMSYRDLFALPRDDQDSFQKCLPAVHFALLRRYAADVASGATGPLIKGDVFTCPPNGCAVDPSNSVVFVGNLNQKVSEGELRDIFAPFGDVCATKIQTGKSNGFVTFGKKAEAEKAIKLLNGLPLAGQRLRLGWGRVSGAWDRNAAGHQSIQLDALKMLREMSAPDLLQIQDAVLAFNGNSDTLLAAIGILLTPQQDPSPVVQTCRTSLATSDMVTPDRTEPWSAVSRQSYHCSSGGDSGISPNSILSSGSADRAKSSSTPLIYSSPPNEFVKLPSDNHWGYPGMREPVEEAFGGSMRDRWCSKPLNGGAKPFCPRIAYNKPELCAYFPAPPSMKIVRRPTSNFPPLSAATPSSRSPAFRQARSIITPIGHPIWEE